MRVSALLFLSYTTLVYAATTTKPNREDYSHHEKACFNGFSVYYQGSCRQLLERSGCQEGEWLILNAKVAPKVKPTCSAVPDCPNTDYIYWDKESRCILKSNQTVCTKLGTGPYYNVFGQAECACKGGKARGMDPATGQCHLLYSQGPCKTGQVFVETGPGRFGCIKNPCPSYDQLFWAPQRKCYPADSQGPCPKGQTLVVDIYSRRPSCNTEAINWHLINLPEICDGTDFSGKCVPSVKLEPQGEKYLTDLILAAGKRKKRGTASTLKT